MHQHAVRATLPRLAAKVTAGMGERSSCSQRKLAETAWCCFPSTHANFTQASRPRDKATAPTTEQEPTLTGQSCTCGSSPVPTAPAMCSELLWADHHPSPRHRWQSHATCWHYQRPTATTRRRHPTQSPTPGRVGTQVLQQCSACQRYPSWAQRQWLWQHQMWPVPPYLHWRPPMEERSHRLHHRSNGWQQGPHHRESHHHPEQWRSYRQNRCQDHRALVRTLGSQAQLPS